MNTEEQDPRNVRYGEAQSQPTVAANPEPVLTEAQIALRAEIRSKSNDEIGEMAAQYGVDLISLINSTPTEEGDHTAIIEAVAASYEARNGQPITQDPSGGPENGPAGENTGNGEGAGSTPIENEIDESDFEDDEDLDDEEDEDLEETADKA